MTSRRAFSPAGDGIRVISRIKTSFTPLQAAHIPTSLFLAGLFLLISVTMVTYAPSLKMGFRAHDDYTVFVHLLDDHGQMVAATDGMPRDGKERTSEWKMNQFTADGHVLRIPLDTPLGRDYHLDGNCRLKGTTWWPKDE